MVVHSYFCALQYPCRFLLLCTNVYMYICNDNAFCHHLGSERTALFRSDCARISEGVWVVKSFEATRKFLFWWCRDCIVFASYVCKVSLYFTYHVSILTQLCVYNYFPCITSRRILQAAETYFSKTSSFLIQFLVHTRSNYQLLFNENYVDWKRISASGTKLGVYKEVN